jgi:phosphonate transport system substrate-binding protein
MQPLYKQNLVHYLQKAIFMTLVAIAGTAATNGQAETIRFAPLPMENRETLFKQNHPMAIYLEKKLNVTIEFIFSDSYADIINKFSEGQVDLAYLGPLPYVELRAKYAKAEPLIHFNEPSGKPMYTCAIVTLADSSLNLRGLKNSRIALTQPLSTCGYLAVHGLLKERGSRLEENRYVYLDKHDSVALAVVRGEFDAGGLKTAIGQKYSHMGLTIAAETAPMPAFSLVANQATLSDATRKSLRDAMIGLEPTAADKDMLAAWGENLRNGAVVAADEDYNVVRKLKGNIEIPTDDKDQ